MTKPGRSVNEDLAVAFDNVFAVFDGASVPVTLERCCDRGARWYVERLAAGVLAHLAGDPANPLAHALSDAIDSVTSEHRGTCSSQGVGPSAAVALVRVGIDAIDYLVLGDCTIAATIEGEAEVVTDTRLTGVGKDWRRSIRARLAEGGTYEHPQHRRDVDALVREQLAVRNTASGFWIASDDPSAAQHAIVGSWPLSAPRQLALFTDGAARAVEVLQVLDSWDEALTALSEDGCETLLHRIRDVEAEDAHGRRFPRTTVSDDATVLYVSPIDRARR